MLLLPDCNICRTEVALVPMQATPGNASWFDLACKAPAELTAQAVGMLQTALKHSSPVSLQAAFLDLPDALPIGATPNSASPLAALLRCHSREYPTVGIQVQQGDSHAAASSSRQQSRLAFHHDLQIGGVAPVLARDAFGEASSSGVLFVPQLLQSVAKPVPGTSATPHLQTWHGYQPKHAGSCTVAACTSGIKLSNTMR